MDHFRAYCLNADDWRRRRVLENFRANLNQICSTATRSGAKVVLSTVPVNLADCPPLGSLHRPNLTSDQKRRWEELYWAGIKLEQAGDRGQALEQYLGAAKLDDAYAELHFRMARCALALGNIARAQEHYNLACEWDALQFRADARLNQVIEQTAAAWNGKGVMLVNTRQAFATNSLSYHGIPGELLFHDHVHPTFAGNWLIASNCCFAVSSLLGKPVGPPAVKSMPSPEQAANALAYTPYSELNVTSAMVRLTSAPPFLDQLDHASRQAASEAAIQKRLTAFSAHDAETSLKACYEALEKRPDDAQIRQNLALFCLELGRYSEAVKQAQAVVEQAPECARSRLDLAAALFKAGKRSEALSQLTEGLRRNPRDKALREAMERITKPR
jgi:tetratricopeptide (TPR) repeat protein